MMNIPQEDVVLPKEVQQSINRARDNVTILEAEQARLEGLVVSLRYTVGEIHKEHSAAVTDLESVRSVMLQLESERVLLMNEVEELHKSVETAKKDFLSAKESSQFLLDEAHIQVTEAERILAEAHQKMDLAVSREGAVVSREIAVADKENKIRVFTQNL